MFLYFWKSVWKNLFQVADAGSWILSSWHSYMTGNISDEDQISHYLGQYLYGNPSTCYLLVPMRPNMQSKNYQLNEVSNMRSLTTLSLLGCWKAENKKRKAS